MCKRILRFGQVYCRSFAEDHSTFQFLPQKLLLIARILCAVRLNREAPGPLKVISAIQM
jgi:hypothetical protein